MVWWWNGIYKWIIVYHDHGKRSQHGKNTCSSFQWDSVGFWIMKTKQLLTNAYKYNLILFLLCEAKWSNIELSSVHGWSWSLLELVKTKTVCCKWTCDNYCFCLQTCMSSSLLVNCAHSAWLKIFPASMLQHFLPLLNSCLSVLAFLQCFLAGSLFLRYWRHSRAVWTCLPVIMAILLSARVVETDMSKPSMLFGKIIGK